MAWDQQELFTGVLSEFASAQAEHTMLAYAREADWASSMHEADIKQSSEWRRRNSGKVRAYGATYRATHRESEVARVRRWKVEHHGKRCARCKAMQPRKSFYVVRRRGKRMRMAYCIPCQRTVSSERKRRIRAEARAA